MAALSSRAVVLLALLGVAGVLPTLPAESQGLQKNDRLRQAAVKALAGGKLLVAARRLPDPNFGHAVILLAEFNSEGAVGLVVNRRSEVSVARVFPHLTPAIASAGPAFLGGPVEKTRPMVLVRASASPPGARHVVDGIYLLATRQAIESAVTSGTTPGHVRVYLGYSGWGPGQLEAETAEGVWHVLSGDADAVFDPDPSSTWQRQIARTELIQARRGEPARRPGALPPTAE